MSDGRAHFRVLLCADHGQGTISAELVEEVFVWLFLSCFSVSIAVEPSSSTGRSSLDHDSCGEGRLFFVKIVFGS